MLTNYKEMGKQRQFRYDNKSVIIIAEQVEDITYKFTFLVDGNVINEYEKEINGLERAMDEAEELVKSLILSG